ncbi:MAG: sensor histidine kinase, partial [Anaerolineales bacterium]|nr:sensor histidine kinase [Anaerolineales bacterium]
LTEAQRREALRGELLRRVVAAQEAERQRIARELHDETGQSLTAIGLGLRGVRQSYSNDPEKASLNLRNLEGMAVSSLQELQRLIADLRPSHLDELGLPAALRWYAGELHARTELEVEVEISGAPRPITGAAKTALFRVAQEALTNVVKHAQATCVLVRLEFQDDSISLAVKDDGRGFQYQSSLDSNYTAWGLLGMRERASLLGGSFSVDTYPGAGTTVLVSLPYQEEGEVEYDHSLAAGG